MAEPVAARIAQAPGVPTRQVLNLLRQHGRLSHKQIFALSPRDIIPTKTYLKRILRILCMSKRAKAFLPIGHIYGSDNFSYKLNPTRRGINFPELYGTTKQKRHLEERMNLDKTGKLRELVEKAPVPVNQPLRDAVKRLRELKGVTL